MGKATCLEELTNQAGGVAHPTGTSRTPLGKDTQTLGNKGQSQDESQLASPAQGFLRGHLQGDIFTSGHPIALIYFITKGEARLGTEEGEHQLPPWDPGQGPSFLPSCLSLPIHTTSANPASGGDGTHKQVPMMPTEGGSSGRAAEAS